MAGNKLLLAVLTLAVLLALTVWKFNAREAEDTRAPEIAVKLPKLKKDDVDELTISVPEKKTVTLKKGEKTWSLTEPLKAPADQSAVDGVLSKLEELEVIGVAATKPENFEKLEVTDKKAIHVLAKKDGKPLADLLIGAYRSGNTMVRETTGSVVATVKGSIKYAFDKDVKDWRDKSIADVTSEQVKSITFDNKGGKFTFVKEGSEWKQAPGDKVLPNFESGKIVSLVGTATTMRAQDFAGDDVTRDAAGVGDKPEGTVILTTGGDAGVQQVVIHAGVKKGDNYYLTREGKDTIFLVSDFAGSRMLSTPDKFQKDETKPAEQKDAKTPVAKAANPHAPHAH
jgi:hypothetical protein